jgi:serine/threonine protein kinase
MEFTVQNVCGLLIRSKLLSPDEVKTMYQRWLDESKGSTNLGQFSKWLSTNHYVTEYQASLITRGHADDFFLNQYKILDRLGRGRMAGVYKAVHQLGQVIAIKVLPPSKAKEPHTLARFLRESRLAMRLKHPNVVRAFQVGEANGLHYLVMEYLEGETLDEVLGRRRQLPPNEAVRLVHQALLGLQHIHDQGLVHRDLKPSNLMLVPAPTPGQPDNTLRATVKILDIGLGRALFDESSPAAPTGGLVDHQLTAEGVLLGTPDYLSPEQARDPRTTDIRADIYSLGCVLYHTLAGQPPFPDTNIISQMVRHATETPRPLKTLNAVVPDGLQIIVTRMMAKDPAHRFPTPDRAAQALQGFLSAGTELPANPEEETRMRRYLTWLETSQGEVVPPAGIPVAKLPPTGGKGGAAPQPPVASPVIAASTPSEKTQKKAQPGTPRKHHSKKHKRRRSALHLALPKSAKPAATPNATQLEEFDVELLPTGAARKDAPSPRVGGLNRRDWMMLGLGAAAVIVAGAIGMGVRWAKEWLDETIESDDSDE